MGSGLGLGQRCRIHNLPQVPLCVKSNHLSYEFGASAPTNMVRAFKNTDRVAYRELSGVSHMPIPPKISVGLGLG